MTSNNQQRHDRADMAREKEKCFLVGAEIPGRYQADEEPLAELAQLVDTAGGEGVGGLTQKLDKPTTRYYLGKGKFYDLVDMALEAGAETIVVDDDLSPAQLSNLEEAARRKVIDRSEVILDIFAHRAQSNQARLQVELAMLQYELPRLARKWTHLERINGGIGCGGGASRGTGEKQLELDRRIVRERIARLRSQLDEIEERKAREVAARDDFTACLVGYTNAGKSTLLNRLAGGEQARAEDRLFATIDTLTRKVALPDGETALVSDTVGFIRRLPHHLVASFHATLEEAAQADLLLVVVDAASPLARAQTRAVRSTLASLGLESHDCLYVFNKIDAAPADGIDLAHLRAEFSPAVEVSAATGQGVEALVAVLQEKCAAGRRSVTVRFPAGDGRRLAVLNQYGVGLAVRYEGEDAVATVRLPPADIERLKRLPGPCAVEDGGRP